MKRNIIFLMIAGFLAVTALAQPPDTLWTRMYGGPQSDACFSVQQTEDGGYILTGYTVSFGAGESDVYLVRTDSQGDTLWTRTFGTDDDDIGNSVCQNSEGGFVVGGSTANYIVGSGSIYLIKTDENGDTLWTKTIGGNQYQECNSILETEDGNYLLGGRTGELSGLCDMFLVKTDTEGDTLWSRCYDSGISESCNCVQQTDDGGFILGGESYINYYGQHDIYLVETDSAGDTIWTRTFGGTDYDGCSSVLKSNDGGYMLGGMIEYPESNFHMYLMKVDADGDSLWANHYFTEFYEGHSGCNSVQQTSEGGYILGGYKVQGESRPHFWSALVKTDAFGEQEWTYTNDDELQQACNSVLQTTDDCIILGGWRQQSYGPYTRDMYLAKFTPDGAPYTKTDPREIPTEFSLSPAYPNPFNPTTTISFDLPVTSIVNLDVFDINGRNITSSQPPATSNYYAPGYHQITFNGSGLSSGIYIYRLEASDFTASGKMVLMK